MSRILGVFVSSNKHIDKIMELCKSAKRKDVKVKIFMTHTGTLLTQDAKFSEIAELADISLCRVSFEKNGLKMPIHGIGNDALASQIMHAELIEDCDRYLVF